MKHKYVVNSPNQKMAVKKSEPEKMKKKYRRTDKDDDYNWRHPKDVYD